MTMAVDNRQQSQMSGLPYSDSSLRYQPAPPQFTNPWGQSTAGAAPTSQYAATLAPPSTSLDAVKPPPLNLQYAGAALSSAPLGSGISVPVAGLLEPPNLLGTLPGLLNTARSYGSEYSSSPSPNAYAPATTSGHYPMSTTAGYGFQDPARRPSHPSVTSANLFSLSNELGDGQSSYVDLDRLSDPQSRSNFSEAIEASRNMMQMRDTDITPRANIYGGQDDRSSVSSYGFPSTHSAHSSISSASYNPSGGYSGYGSVGDSSVTDYSSASESVDLNSRTLPRPTSLIGNNIPPPQSMMGQFSSKVASSSQKKHKCKICDKRFTRPSSLQTHMYSHTGEKRKSET
jgi:hypothetical protein